MVAQSVSSPNKTVSLKQLHTTSRSSSMSPVVPKNTNITYVPPHQAPLPAETVPGHHFQRLFPLASVFDAYFECPGIPYSRSNQAQQPILLLWRGRFSLAGKWTHARDTCRHLGEIVLGRSIAVEVEEKPGHRLLALSRSFDRPVETNGCF